MQDLSSQDKKFLDLAGLVEKEAIDSLIADREAYSLVLEEDLTLEDTYALTVDGPHDF